MKELPLLIAGDWVTGDGRATEDVLDPATGKPVARLTHATANDLDRALAAAAAGFARWRGTPAAQRGAVLKRAAALIRDRLEAIAAILTTEQGKTLAEARGEVALAADVTEWNGEECTRLYGRIVPPRNGALRHLVTREPVGVVAAFTPWNFPAMMPARKLSGALAAGCACILKPSEETPESAVEIVRAYVDAGVPAGVVGLVFGVPAAVSAHLIASPVVRKVSFTGSVPVGRHIGRLAADGIKPATLELGGHAPVLILDDVDPDRLGGLAAAAKFRNAGQVCVSPTRFYVHDRVFDRFADSFVAAARRLRVGPGLAPDTGMGPLANARRVEALEALVGDAVAGGARLATGGRRLGNAGFFFEPTVLLEPPATARLLREEPFGPVALLVRVASLDDALERANALPYGLASYAFTANADHQARIADGIEAGMLGLNTFLIAAPETPFGGVKDSGHGSEGGIEGLETFLTVKFVAQAPAP